MRNVVDHPKWGKYCSTAKAKRDRDSHHNSESCNDVISGWKIKGRSEITKGNHVSATYYRAYKAEMTQKAPVKQKRQSSAFYYTLSGDTTPPNTIDALTYIVAPNYMPAVPAHVVAAARASALSKVQDSSINAAQSIAELRSTARQLSSLVSIGIRSAVAAKKGNWAKAWGMIRGKGSVPDRAANAYLGYTYGIKPFISDVQGGLAAWDKGVSKRAILRQTGTNVTSRPAVPPAGRKALGEWTLGCEVGVFYEITHPEMLLANQLGFANPAQLGWELLPLSFVIDWFVNVGDFLGGIGATIGCTFGGGYQTTFARCEKVEYIDTRWPNTGWSLVPDSNAYPSHELTAFAMERIALNSWPRPSVAVKSGINVNQLASAIALAQQRL